VYALKRAGEVGSMFNDISEVLPIKEIENMLFDEAQNYILKAKAQFSTLRLIKYWKTNSKYVYGKIYKKYNIPTSGKMIKVKHQTKWQEKNENKLKVIIDTAQATEKPIQELVASQSTDNYMQESGNQKFLKLESNILHYLNAYFVDEKIISFSPDKNGLIIVLGSGSKIKIKPLTNKQIKLETELATVYSIR
jgi:Txe/YoeB family toxin of Txe-Axe toxin-antitoxin module